MMPMIVAGLLAGPTIGCGDPAENNANNTNNTTGENNTSGTNNTNNTAGTNNSNNTAGTNNTNNTNGEVTNALTVADQEADPANEVVIASVTSDVAGFVVIHEDDGNGAPGPVIGNASVPAGESTDVTVTLDRDAVDGETLHAMLHVDDPADGDYTFDGANGEDGPALDADGEVVVEPFEVSVAPTPSVEVTSPQQVARVDEVLVARAVSDGPGFIVVHEDDNGAPGPVLGNAALADGENTDVVITLDRTLVDGETVYAMLHTDTGEIGTYEFDGANGLDGPVTDANGDVITPPIEVDLSMAEGRVWVDDQIADPFDEVTIARTFYAQDGFIVIHEQDNTGGPGDVLGNAPLPAGYNADVTVTLSRDIVDGETLFAMLHTDAGNPGVYEFPGPDGPVSDLDGEVITPPFVVNTPQPLVTQANQTLAGVSTRLSVDLVYAVEAGHIVIHEDDGNGSPGPVIGDAPVAVGENTDVEVILSRPAVDGETLHAMLHVDDPADGVYTFDGSNGEDGPVVYMGNVVNTPFQVTVPAGLPAVIFTISNVGMSAYRFTAAEPAAFESWISDTSGNNPTVTLRQGWRYTLDNTAVAGHPIDLGDIDETPPLIGSPNDVIALSQATDPALEGDADVNWVEAGSKASFTLTPTLAGSVDGYVCANHDDMRGAIVIVTQ
jgi:hypothetical protein